MVVVVVLCLGLHRYFVNHMPSQFDSANYPTREPLELVAGDRWTWKRTDLGADYPPASFTLKYSARLDNAATEIEITATASGSDYLIEVLSATTAAFPVGRYRYQAYITRISDAQRITLNSGFFEVKPNRDIATTDPRTHARKVLDSVETAIEGFASGSSIKSYTIATPNGGSRSVTRRDMPDLLVLRDRYRAEVSNEEAKDRVANGFADPRRIGIRFNRV